VNIDLCKPDGYLPVVVGIIFMLIELWLGRTPKFRAGSTLELIYNFFKNVFAITRFITKEKKMELGKGVDVSYANGEVILKGVVKDDKGVEIGSAEVKAKLGYVVNPKLDDVMAKVQSGEIDLIPGTDLEKPVVMQVLQGLKNELNK